MARRRDSIPIRSGITDPKKAGFLYSVKPYAPEIRRQKRYSCTTHAFADFATMFHRMERGDMNIELSPNPLFELINDDGLSFYDAMKILQNNGLEEYRVSPPAKDEIVKNFQYQTQPAERFYIKYFKSESRQDFIVKELVKNFSIGKGYAVAAGLHPMESLREHAVAARTSKEEPYFWGWENDLQELLARGDYDDLTHSVVLTGIFARTDNPSSLDYSFEFKNSHGNQWGNDGYAWVTADAIDTVTLVAVD